MHTFMKIGLEYDLRELLVSLTGQLLTPELAADIRGWPLELLGNEVHKVLLQMKKYLLVLDDIRDTRVWSELEQFFPTTSANNIVIIMTTRTNGVARSACSEENIQPKRFLTITDSWELLCKMSFPETGMCPPKVENVGKKIAGKLLGIPLALVKIGQLLSNSPTTVENWNVVDRDVSQLITKILKPSYTELPHHLKACFLYLGVFPPNYTIPTSQLFKLWAAEGFINVVRDEYERLEEKAEEYLEDLVSRSIVEVHERSSRGGIKNCRVPLLFQYLCVHEAREEKLFHVVKVVNENVAQGIEEQRRLGVLNNIQLGFKKVRDSMRSATDARSLLCMGSQHQRQPLQLYLELRRLKVLHALSIRFWEFPNAVARSVGLKYLAITCSGELPSTISKLWNLETLIINRSQRVHHSVTLPLEIWKLRKLRHLYCAGFDLPDPRDAEKGDSLFLDKLVTLSGVSAGSCTAGILSRMPRLNKIRIWFESTRHAVDNFFFDDDPVFSRLYCLESFKCVFTDLGYPSPEVASNLIVFPSSLRKLTLGGCGFSWDLMRGIGSLLMLQVLKLRSSAFCGPEWQPVVGEFLQLKYLLMEDLDLGNMEVESTNFPVLEQLLVRRCHKLRGGIPLDIGHIPTLSVIEVEDCGPAVIESAMSILREQRNVYNKDQLKVDITSSWHRW